MHLSLLACVASKMLKSTAVREWQVLPEAPEELVSELSRRYIWLYQAITGLDFEPAPLDMPPNERMKQNLSHVL